MHATFAFVHARDGLRAESSAEREAKTRLSDFIPAHRPSNSFFFSHIYQSQMLPNNSTLVVLEILSAVPPTVNPFLAIIEVFSNLFYPPMPRSFDCQLYVLIGIFSLSVAR